MNKLSIIEKGTSIINNTTAVISRFDDYHSIKNVRRAGNKLIYAVNTVGCARQLVRNLDFDEEDYSRLDKLFNAFTYKASDDIMRG